MRKKKLFEQIEGVVLKNNELYDDNVALSKEVERLKARIAELEEELEALNQVAQATEVEEVKEQYVSTEENVTDVTECTKVTQTEPVEVGSDIEIASVDIGEVVLKCAEVCNIFTEHGGPNAKDLVNLALGRTEVFKSDMLAILSANDNILEVRSEINELKAAVFEYFELLKSQL